MACTVDMRHSEKAIIADEQHVVPNRYHVGPVRGRTVTVLGSDEMACTVDMRHSEKAIIADEQHVLHGNSS
jgi:hypothetical protein